MRRKEREVVNFEEIIGIIDKCNVMHLGMVDDGKPYVVPLNFGYEVIGQKVVFYFHSAKQGRKIDLLKSNCDVCIEMENVLEVVKGEEACRWTQKYESVIAFGSVFELIDINEKKNAFDRIMVKNGYEGVPVYNAKVLEVTALYKVVISDLSGKRNL